MNTEQIEKRLAEIAEELRGGNADVEALEKEVAALEGQREELRRAAAERKNMEKRIASGEGERIGGLTMSTKEKRDIFNAGSTEYRDAYIANLMGKELTEEQRNLVNAGRTGFEARAMTMTDAAGVMPTQMVNEINDLVNEQHPIVGDVRRYLTGTILEVPKVKAAGALLSTTSDGEVVFNQTEKITLSGKDFNDYIELPYAAFNMSIEAFRTYIEQLIAEKIGAQVADHIYKKITNDGSRSATMITAAAADPTYNEIATAFGSLKHVNDNNVTVYATRKTVFGKIKGLVDSNKRPVFDPETRTLFGATVKYEDTVPDGSLLIGDPDKVWCNVITDYMVEADKDVKKHNYTVSGYTRLEATLVDPAAFVLLSGKTTG